MKIIENTLNDIQLHYPLEKLAPFSQMLFLDIETTGLSHAYHSIYMIGICYYETDHFVIRQWLAQAPEEEQEILSDFVTFIRSYSTLIHFNGNQFDLPFIMERCQKYGIPFSLDSFYGIDIYKRINPYKHMLKLANCKQKTIEEFLGIHRLDTYSGGELIAVYKEYCKTPKKDLEHLLLQHNYDDVKGMLSLLPILSYADFFQEEYYTKKVQSNSYKDINGIKRKELLIDFSFSSTLPVAISYLSNDCYLSVKGNTGQLRIPVYEEEMKYFYSDYKNYYYLPEEDMAVHKSVSIYVDSAFREQATATTCYTRKRGEYLPQWDYIFEPFFKRDYKSKNLFFELTDDFKSNREAFSKYVAHVMSMFIKTK